MSDNQALSEIQIQSAAFMWAWNTHPQTRRCLFHVPNGGTRNMVEATQLKAAGVVPGIPDLLFVWRGTVYGFECKTDVGKVSSDQQKVHDAWYYQGIKVFVFRSVDEFQDLFEAIINERSSFVPPVAPLNTYALNKSVKTT